ncbi:NUDIX domain-containing protein [Streptomyces chartreusis]|uniref:NUDIX domain-containing protein n=1 Tax=Streptomyces chartreusis TaxID=1969 RepID=UPI00381B4262
MTDDFAAYIDGLPKILAGAAMLCRDTEGRILLVKPPWGEDGTWALPGGTVESDQDETPREAARREVAEELGLDITPGALLAIDWVTGAGWPPLVTYLYDGGILDEGKLATVRLEPKLEAWQLVNIAETGSLLANFLRRRIRAGLVVLTADTGPAELENGYRVGYLRRHDQP